MMWWLTLYCNQIALLIAAYLTLPPITINLDPLYEFIVLGVVPGTSIELDFINALTICVALLLTVLVARTKPTHTNTHQN